MNAVFPLRFLLSVLKEATDWAGKLQIRLTLPLRNCYFAMNKPDIAAILREKLKGELPGESSHLKMIPFERRTKIRFEPQSALPKASSVLLLLYPVQGDALPGTVLIKRVIDNGVHSGQISFPGGRQDDTDVSAIHTALREAKEEIGLNSSRLEVLGTLSPLYVSPSNYLIQPVVAFSCDPGQLVPNPSEAEYLIHLRLQNLESFRTEVDLEVRGFTLRNVPCFATNGQIIWGATAMILQELIDILRDTGNPDHMP